ncbi:methylated-DNA--[protein]-cysteine S-methyltransferase [Phenylobacterium immobile]|uniref:methylated-DNA--[protein]-cysteine S-methyltransferase n=1 Tax=Phenylobacterium immobile TaxID=21 RepID=UPI000AE2EA6D|nr:methylated-DNA--[protein]-cysteine S-methyltransferase [Phenylobacterium immobile]
MTNETPPDLLTVSRLATPIGTALIVSDEAEVLRAFNWTDYEAAVRGWLAKRYAASRVVDGGTPAGLAEAFERYFAGDAQALNAVRWRAVGTPFQLQIWTLLTAIPPGETISYGELARRAGRPTASRASGAANGRNPLALVVPCHRVIGASGALTGYAGGMARKEWLLKHERAAVLARLAA